MYLSDFYHKYKILHVILRWGDTICWLMLPQASQAFNRKAAAAAHRAACPFHVPLFKEFLISSNTVCRKSPWCSPSSSAVMKMFRSRIKIALQVIRESKAIASHPLLRMLQVADQIGRIPYLHSSSIIRHGQHFSQIRF